MPRILHTHDGDCLRGANPRERKTFPLEDHIAFLTSTQAYEAYVEYWNSTHDGGSVEAAMAVVRVAIGLPLRRSGTGLHVSRGSHVRPPVLSRSSLSPPMGWSLRDMAAARSVLASKDSS